MRDYSHHSVETPANCNFTLLKFQKYDFYFEMNCHGNDAATEPVVFGSFLLASAPCHVIPEMKLIPPEEITHPVNPPPPPPDLRCSLLHPCCDSTQALSFAMSGVDGGGLF